MQDECIVICDGCEILLCFRQHSAAAGIMFLGSLCDVLKITGLNFTKLSTLMHFGQG